MGHSSHPLSHLPSLTNPFSGEKAETQRGSTHSWIRTQACLTPELIAELGGGSKN